jgi:Fur family transcriptional regulator, ferric uptake regulator
MTAGLFETLLKSKGLKVTKARLAVLAVLDVADRPRSTDFVHRAAAGLEPMDRVTVYRTLESFHRSGLVERVRAGDRTWRYHLSLEPDRIAHPHFYCSGCGKLECLPRDIVRVDLERMAKDYPARVEHLQINLEGFCPACLEREG